MPLPASRLARVVAVLLAIAAGVDAAEPLPPARAPDTPEAWRTPVAPFRIADRTWYVGTQGLSVLLVRTDAGAILIDGGLPQMAPLVLENLRALGVAPDEVRLIVHSHAHYDHTGPLAALQRATGARVVSNAESAALLARSGTDDPHYGDDFAFPPVRADRLVLDGESVELGGVALTARFTPGHTPGSMSWTWTDTRDGKPVRIAYADSLSAPGYRLVGHTRHPRIVDDYRRAFAAVRALPCDVLITPHPDASGWRLQDPAQSRPITCAAYAQAAEERLERQLAEQRSAEAR